MATTSLWAIKGRVDMLINYVENPEKTSNQHKTKGDPQEICNIMKTVNNYVTNPDKTDGKVFVTGLNCIPERAIEQFIMTKKQFEKDDGRLAYHGYESFAHNEVSPNAAHEIGVKLAKEMWGENYQVIVTTHLDKEHIHNHFCINSVSFKNGLKYDRTNAEYNRMRAISDRLCHEYSLSVIEEPKPTKTPRMIHLAEKNGELTRYNIYRQAIDVAIKCSWTDRAFLKIMRESGYEINFERKYVTIKSSSAKHPTRLKTLGEDYAWENIVHRIIESWKKERQTHVIYAEPKRYNFRGTLKTTKKLTGFRALVFHYMYLMGIIPKNKPRQVLHPALLEDVRKMKQISEQAILLCKNKIDTIDDLNAYVSYTSEKKQELTQTRYQLANLIRRKVQPPNLEDIKIQRKLISTEIKKLNRNLWLAGQIEERSKKMKETITAVHKFENEQRRQQQNQTKSRGYTR
jgi:hypothetical protein